MVDSAVRPAPPARNGFAATSAPAQRTRRARWRDGRLVLGVLLVAVTALVGAKLVSSADDTVAVWAAKRNVPAGSTLSADDLTSTRVRFTSEDTSSQYVPADTALDGLVAVRALGAGELVPRAATATRRDSDRIEMPLSVATGKVPGNLSTGDQVDVWVVPKADKNLETPDAVKVWEHVRVLDVDAAKGVSASSSSRRQVLVALEPKHAAKLSESLRQVSSGEPVLVRRAR